MTRNKRPIRSVACLGEVMIELIADKDGAAQLGVAGDTYNSAVYLARLLRPAQVPVSYVTALGNDPYSLRILTALTAHGIDDTLIETRPGMMPGLYAIDTDEHGERSFSYWRSAAAARTLFTPPCTIAPTALDALDMILLSGISLAILPPKSRDRLIAYLQQFSANGGTVVYDSNYRPALWEDVNTARMLTARMWQGADIALPSVDDEMALFEDASEDAALERLKSYGITRGALKRGAQGPLDLSGKHPTPPAPGFPVDVVDSTAAGDSFNAGYLAALIQGHDDSTAMARGHALAARVIGCRGAIIPPDRMPQD
ncbi:sugar kinase [Thiosulfatihalobacter marinus]|uniref:sugar kinase n=1 Tax=Thiosulfatihalobacter marinus TaxID=2792481 RepID=UPI001E3A2CEF|nr:sugar kinase [Thiosulfatihalobacter marinus]